MNIFDQTYELSDYQEDCLAVTEHAYDVEPDWYLEQDLKSNCMDQGEITCQ